MDGKKIVPLTIAAAVYCGLLFFPVSAGDVASPAKQNTVNRNDSPCLMTFMQLSDVHVGAEENKPVHKRLQAAVELANSLGIDLVIDTGDICHDPVYAPTEKNFREFSEYKHYLADLNMPYYVVPGNHDIGYFDNDLDPRKRNFGDGDLLAARFRKDIGPLDQSFVFRNFRFLLINNNPSYGNQPGYLSDRQLGWIRHELQRAQKQNQTALLFMHIPVLNPKTGKPWGKSSQKLATLVKKYHVVLVAYGHNHIARQCVLDGTCYATCPDLKTKGHTKVYLYRFYADRFDLWEYDVLTQQGKLLLTYPLAVVDAKTGTS